MRPRIGLIGVPVETVFLNGDFWDGVPYTAFIPQLTTTARDAIITHAKKEDIAIDDLGEVDFGAYDPGFNTARIAYQGISPFSLSKLKFISKEMLEQKRVETLASASAYDIFLAVGNSHAGAVLLYESHDKVTRCDYHADFGNFPKSPATINYANYMDWVHHALEGVHVSNYFVKYFQEGKNVYGTLAGDSPERNSVHANHFDIDVDCFDTALQIQSLYPHANGANKVKPVQVSAMIRASEDSRPGPFKIGFWEYRCYDDARGEGITFIVDSITQAMQRGI